MDQGDIIAKPIQSAEREHTMIQQHLEYYEVPYADLLAKIFPIATEKARLDFEQLLVLIGSIALLNTYQRPIVYQDKPDIRFPPKTHVLALPIDLYMALRIASKSLRETLSSVADRMCHTLALFKNREMTLTVSVAAEGLGLSESRTRQILNVLVKTGYLFKSEKVKIHEYGLKTSEQPELIAPGDLAIILRCFDRKALESYMVSKNLISLQREIPFIQRAIDPLTGKKRDINGMIVDLSRQLALNSDIAKLQERLETKGNWEKPEKYPAVLKLDISDQEKRKNPRILGDKLEGGKSL